MGATKLQNVLVPPIHLILICTTICSFAYGLGAEKQSSGQQIWLCSTVVSLLVFSLSSHPESVAEVKSSIWLSFWFSFQCIRTANSLFYSQTWNEKEHGCAWRILKMSVPLDNVLLATCHNEYWSVGNPNQLAKQYFFILNNFVLSFLNSSRQFANNLQKTTIKHN